MKQETSKKSIFFAIIVFLVFALIAAISFIKLKDFQATATKMPSPPLAVKTIEVKEGEIKSAITALATVKSAAQIQIKAETGGKILSLPLREGDHVAKGQLLALIDSSEQTTRVKAAKAKASSVKSQVFALKSGLEALKSQKKALINNLSYLTKEYKRAERLFQENAISASNYENARNRKIDAESKLTSVKAQIDSQQSQINSIRAQSNASNKEVNLLEIQQNYNEVRSPVEGVISMRLQEEGSLVMPGVPIVTIDKGNKIRLIIKLPQNLGQNLKTGDSILIKNPIKKEFKITRIYPSVNQFRQLTFEAEAGTDNLTTRQLKFDMQVEVKIVLATTGGSLVPSEACFINFNNPDEITLYLVQNKHATRKSLKPLLVNENGTAVFSPNQLPPDSILAQGSYLENVRLPASFTVEVIK
ncbi:MAG: efflux RND transporter periplasmic adaptor subunit [Candidatus Rifleibacteriota bacterium]